jgi:GT2 family glycosyltransferase
MAEQAAETQLDDVGIVAIGRNEGERLRSCLESARRSCRHVVYVDSGSTDGSTRLALQLGCEVVELDLSTPFTAGRARNEGVERLLRLAPGLAYVQFVDGDCELAPNWLRVGVEALDRDNRLAVVCGRRRERYPNATVYNMLCDVEWDTPIGRVRACGGDAMYRVEAFQRVGGFNPTVIAGEEPELCVRLRKAGWEIERIDAEMTLHDAAMMRFSQWWRRNVRAGHAYAEGYAMHGQPPERHAAKETRSNWFWGVGLPLVALGLAWPTHGWTLLALLLYPLQVVRVMRKGLRKGLTDRQAWAYGASIVLGKFAQAIGQVQFYVHRLLGKKSRIIEYKGTAGGLA